MQKITNAKKQATKVGRFTSLTLFLLFLFIVSFSSVLAVGINNPDIPRVIPESPLTFLNGSGGGGSGGNCTFPDCISQSYADANYWRLNGANAPPSADWNMGLFGFKNLGPSTVNDTMTFYDSAGSGTNILVNSLEGETNFVIEGEVTDGFVCNGYADTSSVVNSFCSIANTLFTPSLNNREWWSYASSPILNGTANSSSVKGFSSAPVSRIAPGLLFNGTIREYVLYEAGNGSWASGTLDNLYYFRGIPIPKVGGVWNNLYGLVLPDINQGLISNFAIKTGLGLVSFNGRTNITDDGNVTSGYFIGNGTRLTGVCLSNGTNCPPSSGGNSSFNQSLTDSLYSSIIWGYNQTTPAINVAQNYSQIYYAQQGYRETICYSMGNLANSGFLSFGGLVHTANQGFTPLHNGSILGATVQWAQTGGAIIAGNEVNGTYYLNISSTNVFQNNITFVQTSSFGRFINTANRGQYNFTTNDNVTVSYIKTAGTGGVGVKSYCVEFVYDN